MKADFSAPIAQLSQTSIDIRTILVDLKGRRVVVHISRLDSAGAFVAEEHVTLLAAATTSIINFFLANIAAPLTNAMGKTITNVQDL